MKFDGIDWEDDDLDPAIIDAYNQSQVGKWVKQSNRKNARLIRARDGAYDIVYQHNGKARVGTVRDGQPTRYGIEARGAMTTPSISTLWQASAGRVSEEEIKIMQDYLRGESTLPRFDFGILKGLTS